MTSPRADSQHQRPSRLRLLELQDRAAAALVDRDQLVGLALQAASRERSVESGGVFADESDVVH